MKSNSIAYSKFFNSGAILKVLACIVSGVVSEMPNSKELKGKSNWIEKLFPCFEEEDSYKYFGHSQLIVISETTN